MYFAQAIEAARKGEPFAVPGDERSRLTTIHCDDLAEMYVAAAEKVRATTRVVTQLTLLPGSRGAPSFRRLWRPTMRESRQRLAAASH